MFFAISTFMVLAEIFCAFSAYYHLLYEDKYKRVFLIIISLVTSGLWLLSLYQPHNLIISMLIIISSLLSLIVSNFFDIRRMHRQRKQLKAVESMTRVQRAKYFRNKKAKARDKVRKKTTGQDKPVAAVPD